MVLLVSFFFFIARDSQDSQASLEFRNIEQGSRKPIKNAYKKCLSKDMIH